MYQSYFGLSEVPFSIAPDPRFLYLSQRHQEALAHLLYGVNGDGGFVLLTGEVGTGKTTVCRCLLEQIPDSCDVAYIFNPKLTVEELLSTICAEFGIAFPADNTSIKVFVDCINTYLLDAHARGRHTVLIIDEAQNLSADVLEQMRLLTNLETNTRKLLQIILLGQPELAAMLQRPELRQLAQRIVARYHLGPLSRSEVAAYMQHRLEVSGTDRQLFPASLIGRVYRLTGGVPRLINALCDRALLGAYTQGKERIDGKTLMKAAHEVFYRPSAQRYGMMLRYSAAGIILFGGAALAVVLYQANVKPSAQAARPKTPDKTADAKLTAMLPTVLEWPDDTLRSRSKAMAYAALFREWGTEYRAIDACMQATTLGLRCRIARGGIEELRQLNRPAVLQMRDAQGKEFYATLTGLADKVATFAVASKTRSVALEALAAQWTGNYALLWRAPSYAHENIRPGERGLAVGWLHRQLEQREGAMADTSKDPVFDDAMVHRVKQFQLAQGLIPDGAVGPQTLIRLSGVADKTAPTLINGQREK